MNNETKKSVEEIINHIGGINNVSSVYHCATRLRFQVKDNSKINTEKLENINGVLAYRQLGQESQLVIGGKVGEYYSEVVNNYDIEDMGEVDDSEAEKADNSDNKNIFMKIIDEIVGVMSPIIIALIGFGLLRALLVLLVLFGLSEESMNYQIINTIGDSVFYFLPVLIAASAARQFKTNQFLALGIVGALLHPNMIEMMAGGEALNLFGLPIRSVSYSGTVVPIILIVWFMSYVDRFAERVVPEVLKTMLKPVMIVVITAPVALMILGPIGAVLGDGLFNITNYLNVNIPWLVPMFMGLFSPLLVMVGMHTVFSPLVQISFSNVGYENIRGPGALASNIAQAGTAFGVFVKSKDKKMKQIALSASITALSGITEPALYGVNLKLKKPLIYAMISGGIAGFYAGITGLVRYSYGSPGLLTLPVFFGENPMNIIHALITVAIAFLVSFALTFFLGWDTEEAENNEQEQKTFSPDEPITNLDSSELYAFTKGEIIPMNKVNDEVFATEVMGKGIAIRPEEGEIVSPVNGKVNFTMNTGHAIGLTDQNGQEYLIHIGIDTVQLDGKGFNMEVKKDDEVEIGDKLVEVDLDYIEKQGYDPTTILVILENPDVDFEINVNENIEAREQLLSFK